MFHITVAKKEDLSWTAKYLGVQSKGITLACYEDEKITGAVCFDIIDGKGILQRLRTQQPEMKEVVAKAALNFLELHHILEVYTDCEDERAFFRMLGFRETNARPKGICGKYAAYLNLDGYFTSKEHKKGRD